MIETPFISLLLSNESLWQTAPAKSTQDINLLRHIMSRTFLCRISFAAAAQEMEEFSALARVTPSGRIEIH